MNVCVRACMHGFQATPETWIEARIEAGILLCASVHACMHGFQLTTETSIEARIKACMRACMCTFMHACMIFKLQQRLG